MSLNRDQLEDDIKVLLTEMLTREQNSIDEFAKRLSTSIDEFVKSATINYQDGLTAGGKPVVGSFNGQLE